MQQCFDEDGVLENCRTIGAYLQEKLAEITKKYAIVKEVRGRGLMLGVVLDRPAAPLAALLLKRNLICLTAGETVLRLVPPLVITKSDADFAIEAIDSALEEWTKSL